MLGTASASVPPAIRRSNVSRSLAVLPAVLLPAVLLIAGSAPLWLAREAHAQEDTAPGTASVGLDQLLKLPSGYDVGGVERRAGATSATWRARFAVVHLDEENAQLELAEAEAELAGSTADSSQWQMQAPGLPSSPSDDPSEVPVSMKARARVKRARADIKLTERASAELAIQADLADVPEAWRRELLAGQ